ncbi:hypothetical protein, partial [Waltera sp.]|uniref:hypothetical protein n=1 Tax=Waltera sp. TaxID=2815806 RepID=UPI00307777EA
RLSPYKNKKESTPSRASSKELRHAHSQALKHLLHVRLSPYKNKKESTPSRASSHGVGSFYFCMACSF